MLHAVDAVISHSMNEANTMSFETVLLATLTWLFVGLLAFRWASRLSAREEACRVDELEWALEEASREKARLARELEATRADLRWRGSDRAAPVQ